MQRNTNARGAVGGLANSSPVMAHSSIRSSSSRIDISRTGRCSFAPPLAPSTKCVWTSCQQTDCAMKEKAPESAYHTHPRNSTASPPQQQPSSISSASPNPTSGDKRRVRFDPVVRGRLVDTTPHDLLNSWHTPDEFRRLQDASQAEAKVHRYLLKKRSKEPLSHEETVALDAMSIRGIEQFVSRRSFVEREQKQRAVIRGVLAEQQRQRCMASSRPSPSTEDAQKAAALSDDLALLSTTFSHDAQRSALKQGQIDAIEAAHCHMSG